MNNWLATNHPLSCNYYTSPSLHSSSSDASVAVQRHFCNLCLGCALPDKLCAQANRAARVQQVGACSNHSGGATVAAVVGDPAEPDAGACRYVLDTVGLLHPDAVGTFPYTPHISLHDSTADAVRPTHHYRRRADRRVGRVGSQDSWFDPAGGRRRPRRAHPRPCPGRRGH